MPTGSNILTLLRTDLIDFDELLLNFYQVQSADFFIILILQQTMFSVFGNLNCIHLVLKFGISPTGYLMYKKLTEREQEYLKNEFKVYDFGYSFAADLVVIGIIFIYS